MNWIQGIQSAIDYVEANITEEIDLEEAARHAYSSSFHFQRVFGILCGFSLGEYIRMRRLSLAGEELSRGNAKIIDIAMSTDTIRRRAFRAPLPDSMEFRQVKQSAAARFRYLRLCLSN